MLILLGVWRASGGNNGVGVLLIIAGMPLVFGALVSANFYEMTMDDSVAILKVSLLIGMMLSVVGVFSIDLGASIIAFAFLISSVPYDFVRDAILQAFQRKCPRPNDERPLDYSKSSWKQP